MSFYLFLKSLKLQENFERTLQLELLKKLRIQNNDIFQHNRRRDWDIPQLHIVFVDRFRKDAQRQKLLLLFPLSPKHQIVPRVLCLLILKFQLSFPSEISSLKSDDLLYQIEK